MGVSALTRHRSDSAARTASHSALLAVDAKLHRARGQIEELRPLINDLLGNTGFQIISRVDSDADEEIWSFVFDGTVPRQIAIIIGEILHNLRTPLDHLVWALAERNHRASREAGFPFGNQEAGFEQQLAKKCKALSASAKERIRGFSPYPDGNPLLWAVHNLNRSDKHRAVIPVNVRTESNKTSYLFVHAGMALVIGSRQGQHLVVERRGPEEIAAMSSPTGIYRVRPGYHVSFGTKGCSAAESLEFLITTPDAKFETDMQPSFDLFFEKPIAGEHMPVIPALRRMRDEVVRVVTGFRQEFAFNCHDDRR